MQRKRSSSLDGAERRRSGIRRIEPRPARRPGRPRRACDAVPVYQWALPEDVEPLRSRHAQWPPASSSVVLFTTATQAVHLMKIADELQLGESRPRRAAADGRGLDWSDHLRRAALARHPDRSRVEPSQDGVSGPQAAEQSADILARKLVDGSSAELRGNGLVQEKQGTKRQLIRLLKPRESRRSRRRRRCIGLPKAACRDVRKRKQQTARTTIGGLCPCLTSRLWRSRAADRTHCSVRSPFLRFFL